MQRPVFVTPAQLVQVDSIPCGANQKKSNQQRPELRIAAYYPSIVALGKTLNQGLNTQYFHDAPRAASGSISILSVSVRYSARRLRQAFRSRLRNLLRRGRLRSARISRSTWRAAVAIRRLSVSSLMV